MHSYVTAYSSFLSAGPSNREATKINCKQAQMELRLKNINTIWVTERNPVGSWVQYPYLSGATQTHKWIKRVSMIKKCYKRRFQLLQMDERMIQNTESRSGTNQRKMKVDPHFVYDATCNCYTLSIACKKILFSGIFVQIYTNYYKNIAL